MAAGLISEDEFRQYAGYFLLASKKINDIWEVRESARGEKYLYKRTNKLVKQKQFADSDIEPADRQGKSCPGETTPDKSVLQESDWACMEEADDGVTVDINTTTHDVASGASTSDNKELPLVYEYHVVYSKSYNVPVLYFNVYKPDGSLLCLNDVWDTVPDVYRDRLQQERWTFLTQQEHPLLGRPFYQLHPCHTADLMSQVLQPEDTKQHKNYLISWLSAVGPVVGLDLPLSYAMPADNT